MMKNDGGPAFPTCREVITDHVSPWGMSLRDWFAGQALVLYADRKTLTATFEESEGALGRSIAETCYLLADAMLAERDK